MPKKMFVPLFKPNPGLEWIAIRPLSRDGSRNIVIVRQVTDAFFSDGLGFVGSQVIVDTKNSDGEIPFTAVYPLEAFYYLYEPHITEELEAEEFALAT